MSLFPVDACERSVTAPRLKQKHFVVFFSDRI